MSATVISVYPQALKFEFPWSENKQASRQTYSIEKGSPEAPARMVVNDAFQKIYAGEFVGHRFDFITAHSIADNFVKCFASGVLGAEQGLGPGLMVLDPDRPEDGQIAELVAKQEAYFQALVEDAEDNYRKGTSHKITNVHRMAAIAMGREGLEWVKPRTRSVLKDCPFCYQRIPVQAIVCAFCRRDLDTGAGEPEPEKFVRAEKLKK